MKFWEIYFKFIEVLKQQLSVYEELLAQWPQNTSAASVVKGSEKRESISTKSALVIEPIERNRVLISKYLTAISVKVSFAANEAEADHRAAQEKFDLKISTVGMKLPEDKGSLLELI